VKLILSLVASLTFAFASAQVEMPDPTPPSEVGKLAFLVGNWEGTMKIFDPSGASMESKSSMNTTMAIGGRFLHAMETISMEGMQIGGLFLATYDAEKKKYVSWWYDQMSAEPVVSEGEFVGSKLIFVSKPVDMPGMGSVTFRSTYDKKSDTEFVFILEMKMGEEWIKFMEGTFKKT
jgi:hypothetical protein